jgi:hypothetical protein
MIKMISCPLILLIKWVHAFFTNDEDKKKIPPDTTHRPPTPHTPPHRSLPWDQCVCGVGFLLFSWQVLGVSFYNNNIYVCSLEGEGGVLHQFTCYYR